MSPDRWGALLDGLIKILAPFENKPVIDYEDFGCLSGPMYPPPPDGVACQKQIGETCLDLINKNAAATGQTAEEYLRSIVNTCTKAKNEVDEFAAGCAPQRDATRTKGNASERKPAVHNLPTTASPGVKPNNLDRFGLGPSFVTGDPSLPNQRGAGKPVQGGSSKAKTTTSLAKPPSTDSKRPSVDPNARIITPTEQIK